jgi:hypothetical protein
MEVVSVGETRYVLNGILFSFKASPRPLGFGRQRHLPPEPRVMNTDGHAAYTMSPKKIRFLNTIKLIITFSEMAVFPPGRMARTSPIPARKDPLRALVC